MTQEGIPDTEPTKGNIVAKRPARERLSLSRDGGDGALGPLPRFCYRYGSVPVEQSRDAIAVPSDCRLRAARMRRSG